MSEIKPLSPEESLEIISTAIQQTKENFKEQSFYYLVWGWLVTITALIDYSISNFTTIERSYLSWMIATPIGWIICYIYFKRQNRKHLYETYIDSFLKYLWIVIGSSLLFSIFISIRLEIQPIIFILISVGTGTLVSGLIMKFNPFIAGGILFFFFAILSLYINPSVLMLIYAVAIFVGYLIPAYILKKS